MKKAYLIVSLILCLSVINIYSQEDYPKGVPIGRIFVDYKYSLDKDEPYQGFSVNRAWFGYKYYIDEHFSAQVIADIGSPLSTVDASQKRYAFLRNALVSYNKDKITVTVGLTDTRIAKTELKLWGKRYISRPFLLKYKFTNVADLGIVLDYQASDFLNVEALILNGEGYTNIETDNRHLYGFGMTFTPADGFILHLYVDSYKGDEGTKNTLSGTAGYRSEKYSIGLGYNYKTDFDWTDGHNIGGFTAFGGVNLIPDLEIFGRYDLLISVTPEGESEGWNVMDDGSFVIAGAQYRFINQVKASINYQGWIPASTASITSNYLMFNLEFRF